MHGLFSLISRFGRDERGVFAVIFGLMAIVLVALGGAVVDYVSLEQARNRGQIALDAAALALQPEIFDDALTTEDIRLRAEALVINRIGDDRIAITVGPPVIDTDLGSLFFAAEMTVPTIFVSLVGVQSLPARIQSEVRRGSLDVEVAVAVDVTGSMNDRVPTGDGWQTEAKIDALERALGELIDVIVKDQQEPSYSKMAIVPYSMGVNVGGYAATIRGAVTPPTAITNITWSTGSAKTITGATKQNPVVITSNNHGFANGDRVYISGVSGMTQINNAIFTVAGVTSNQFQLQGINGTSYSTHSGSTGRATKCLVWTCEMVVTSPNHGLSTGANAYIYGAGGMNNYNSWNAGWYDRYNQYPTSDNSNYNWINNNPSYGDYRFITWTIGTTTQNTFVLPGTARTNGKSYGTYTSGGNVACVTAGCEYFLFQNRYSNDDSWRRHQISTCATERTTNGLNDSSPATTLLGRNYPTPANPCPSVTIQPLTDNKTVLHALAEDLPAQGSTAGHLGIGWAWYLVSPRFNGPWPAASQPAPADEPNVLRAVVLMTDGAFNTSYCDGVISQISSSGSGSDSSKINCNPANGDSYTQAAALCAAMKAADPTIRVYTVAFDVGDIQSAQDIMANCATDSSHAFEATTGGDLSDIFAQIGENLAYLRVTR